MSEIVADGMFLVELIIQHGSLGPAELSTLKMTNSKVGHFVLSSSRAQKLRMQAQSDPQRAADAAVWMASNGSLLADLAVDVRMEGDCSMVATALHVAAATSFAHAAVDAAQGRESSAWAAAMVAQGSVLAARKAARTVCAAAARRGGFSFCGKLAVANRLAQVATEEAVLACALAHDRMDMMQDFVAAKELAAEGGRPGHAALQQLARQLYPCSGLQLVNFDGHCVPEIHLLLKQLKECTGLKNLQLVPRIEPQGQSSFVDMQPALAEVSLMSSLQQLKLPSAWPATAPLAVCARAGAPPSLAGLTCLTELVLGRPMAYIGRPMAIYGSGCHKVGELPMSLQTLKLFGCFAPPSNIRQLQQLEELHLDGDMRAFLPELVHLKRLTCVNLSWIGMVDENENGQDFALQAGHALAALTSLKEVHLSQEGDKVSREAAQQLWRSSGRTLPVASLDLRDVNFGMSTGPVVASMQHLMQLSFKRCSMVGSELAAVVSALPGLVDLKVIDLDVTSALQGQGAFALLCGAVAQSRSLQTLTLAALRNLGSAQEGFAQLAVATHLQSLNLTNCCGVCNDVVVQLAASHTQLTKLVLDHNPDLDKAVVLPQVQQLLSLRVLAWDKMLEVDKVEMLLHIPSVVFEYDDRGFVEVEVSYAQMLRDMM